MNKSFEITFKGTDELMKLVQERTDSMKKNAETAVAKTVLLGVARIANDAPIDTGRLRASIAGEFGDITGVDLKGDPDAISDGKSQSATELKGLKGRVGTNVEYALYQEYGTGGRAVGTNKRSGATLYAGAIKGKGFFRRNIPIIENYFDIQMEEAVHATKEGRLLREGK